MAFVAYLIAAVLFLVAGFHGGVSAGWDDFVAFGLASFALGHLLPAAWPGPRP